MENPLSHMESIGKVLFIGGVTLALLGLILWFSGGKGWLTWIGHLPGDIRVQTKSGGGFYFPITTCLVFSVLISVFASVIRKLSGS